MLIARRPLKGRCRGPRSGEHQSQVGGACGALGFASSTRPSRGGSVRMPAFEPGKIRNVAVVGHRGTGKTSLVEALLFQAGETNRLGTIEAGTTVSDSDADEQRRAVSISLSLAQTEWHGREIKLVDGPADPSCHREDRC